MVEGSKEEEEESEEKVIIILAVAVAMSNTLLRSLPEAVQALHKPAYIFSHFKINIIIVMYEIRKEYSEIIDNSYNHINFS